MLRFYDFLFYLVYKYYSRKEKGAAFSSAGVIGLLQALNVLTVFMLIAVFLSYNVFFNKVSAIVVGIFFQITTYIRYVYKETNSFKVIEEKWLRITEPEKIRIRSLAAAYISLTILIFFGLAIFFGGRK